MRPEKYEFEGKLMTANEVKELIPILQVGVIRKYLQRGMKSRTEILSYRPMPKSERARLGKEKSYWKYISLFPRRRDKGGQQ